MQTRRDSRIRVERVSSLSEAVQRRFARQLVALEMVFNVIDTVFGGDDSWNRVVAKPRDQHWYYFRTAESFNQGSTLLLEAGIYNTSWFFADDVSISTADDIDLKLDRIMVRSCPA